MVVNAHISRWRRTRRESRSPTCWRGDRARRTTAERHRHAGTRCGRSARSLPPRQRAAVVLRFYEDLDVRRDRGPPELLRGRPSAPTSTARWPPALPARRGGPMTDDGPAGARRSARGCGRRPSGPRSGVPLGRARARREPAAGGAAAGRSSGRWPRSWRSRGTAFAAGRRLRTARPAARPTAPPRRRRRRAGHRLASRVVARAHRRSAGRLGLGHRADTMSRGDGPALLCGGPGRRCREDAAGQPERIPVGGPADHALGRAAGTPFARPRRRRTSGWARTSSRAPSTSATATPRRPSRRSARTLTVGEPGPGAAPHVLDSARRDHGLRGVSCRRAPR